MKKDTLSLPKEWTDKLPYTVDIIVYRGLKPSDTPIRWATNNLVIGEWACKGFNSNYRFCFKNESDAIWFKLRWL